MPFGVVNVIVDIQGRAGVERRVVHTTRIRKAFPGKVTSHLHSVMEEEGISGRANSLHRGPKEHD